MQRSFLLNLALLLVLNLLVKPFYILGIDAGVQDAVGSAGYGTYAALLSLSFLLNIVLDLGMTSYNTRHIAQHTHLMGKTLGGVVGVRLRAGGPVRRADLGHRAGAGLQRCAARHAGHAGAEPSAGGHDPVPAQQHRRGAALQAGQPLERAGPRCC